LSTLAKRGHDLALTTGGLPSSALAAVRGAGDLAEDKGPIFTGRSEWPRRPTVRDPRFRSWVSAESADRCGGARRPAAHASALSCAAGRSRTTQLWNVLRGDMSLIGPRPERPSFVHEFKYKVPQYMLRHKVKAGITGWAQVNGWRGNTSLEKRIEYDLYYIENWSIRLDLKII
jgi:hypothetical protein